MVMLLVLICNALLIRHAEINTSVLEEEPIGLLGSAVLLNNSDLTKYLTDRLDRPLSEGTIDEGIEKSVRGLKFWFDHDTRRIRLKRDNESLNSIIPMTASQGASQRASQDNPPQITGSMGP